MQSTTQAHATGTRVEPQVADLMTEPFISVRPGMPATAAAAHLRTHDIRTAPVLTAEGQLVGVLSRSDLGLRAAPAEPVDDARRPPFAARASVADLMRPYVVTVAPTAAVADAENLMRRHGLRWLAVMDARGCVVGVLSRSAIEGSRTDASR